MSATTTIRNPSITATTTLSTQGTRLIGDYYPPMTTSSSTSFDNTPSAATCPHCGDQSSSAQQRIQELEAQVRFLSAKVSGSDQTAEYEDETRNLRIHTHALNHTTSNGETRASTSSSATDQAPRSTDTYQQQQQQQQQQGRFANFAAYFPSYRRGGSKDSYTSTPPPTSHSTHTTTSSSPPSSSHQTLSPPSTSISQPQQESELQTALTREQNLRKAAESQLSQASSELEELTAQLFSQANEMVAQERKARAKLEERVALLEKRDGEKRKRLDRLEKAIDRVERVKALIDGH
ncbi:hypothetical protein BGW36DRAFT_353672 [Talaromyces proteolyticus]|uniref:GDP/GTP exchange factor Sec2 N-terminal domain-containing protein n=1 Tax=Talaromyces proteolyticus TaxID=1131652 RepID=A0AAD4L3I4_9EURO|nr:uncharacterized protein BGW36DRAFT_353672 [Talaromyces proteolyticus]KAH8705262.1 hypothetical protein BGW36DRAFT_353672 [Talaromyces proteolyticus]